MALTGQQFTIAAGEHEATVVEVGAGLRSYRYRGEGVTGTYPPESLPPKCCGVVLVPWPNRLRGGRYTFEGESQQLALTEPLAGNAIHGLARWARWTPVRFEAASVALECDIVPQTGWPFEVRVGVTYALDADAGLSVTATATNLGTGPAPFGAGFHPYLSTRGHRLADTTLRLPARQHVVLDELHLPVGVQDVVGTAYDYRRGRKVRTLPLDEGFAGLHIEHGQGSAEVRTSSGGGRVWFDASFGHLQVFAYDDFPGGGAAIAIEPMSCPADAFNSGTGLIVLAPAASWTGRWGIVPL